MTTRTFWMISIGLSLGLLMTGCMAHPSLDTSGWMGHTAMEVEGSALCPLEVEGTSVDVADVDGGVALLFTAEGGAAELRERVAHVVRIHNQDYNAVHSRASSDDIPNGASLILSPSNPSDLKELRERVHYHATQMAKGICPFVAAEKDSEPWFSGGGDIPDLVF